MSLTSRLEDDLKSALKTRNSVVLSTLRMVIAALKNEEFKRHGKLEDADVIDVLSTFAKQRRESIEAYEQGGRTDLADKEKRELEIVQGYLPKQLTEAEIAAMIDEAIAESSASSPKDMGKVMKIVTPKTKGRADGKTVSELVRKKLTS